MSAATFKADCGTIYCVEDGYSAEVVRCDDSSTAESIADVMTLTRGLTDAQVAAALKVPGLAEKLAAFVLAEVQS